MPTVDVADCGIGAVGHYAGDGGRNRARLQSEQSAPLMACLALRENARKNLIAGTRTMDERQIKKANACLQRCAYRVGKTCGHRLAGHTVRHALYLLRTYILLAVESCHESHIHENKHGSQKCAHRTIPAFTREYCSCMHVSISEIRLHTLKTAQASLWKPGALFECWLQSVLVTSCLFWLRKGSGARRHIPTICQ